MNHGCGDVGESVAILADATETLSSDSSHGHPFVDDGETDVEDYLNASVGFGSLRGPVRGNEHEGEAAPPHSCACAISCACCSRVEGVRGSCDRPPKPETSTDVCDAESRRERNRSDASRLTPRSQPWLRITYLPEKRRRSRRLAGELRPSPESQIHPPFCASKKIGQRGKGACALFVFGKSF